MKIFAMNENLHIGKIIQDALAQQDRNPSWLASRIHCSRTNGYKILERSNIDVDLLRVISLALNQNLFRVIADEMDILLLNNKIQNVE